MFIYFYIKLVVKLANLLWLPIIAYLIFLTFILSLLACGQVLISPFLFNFYCKSAGLLELRVRLVSSAYILGTEYRGHAGGSFM